MARPSVFVDHQNYFELSSIQTVSLGLVGMILGKQLAEQYGPGPAILSIFVGNLILWLIGLAIVSMVYQQHTNAIENIKGYMGKFGALLFAFLLVIAFIDWYVLQINITLDGLNSLFQSRLSWNNGWTIRIGSILGILSALLAIGGIRLLKWVATAAFPLVVIYNGAMIYTSDYSIWTNWKWGLSLSAILSTILMLLPGVINLPTFFRHSRSRADSFLALTLMLLFYTLFECASIWMNFSPDYEFSPQRNSSPSFSFFILPTALILAVTSICSNLLNIYMASACYESFIPRFQGVKGHVIMGMFGTAAYLFVQISTPIAFLANLFNAYVGVIGIVLLIAVLIRLIVKHRPRKFERTINVASWAAGSLAATLSMIQNPKDGIHSLLTGMAASALFFILVFFVEETLWSIQKIRSSRIE